MRGICFPILVLIWLCFLGSAAYASSDADTALVVKALKLVDQGQETQARREIGRVSNPVAKDLLDWYRFTRGVEGANFQDIATFIKSHQDWPYLDILRLEAEKRITDSVPDVALISWFSENPPITLKGVNRYSNALIARGKRSDAQIVLRKWWGSASLTRDQQRDFYTQHSRDLDDVSHIDRLNGLLYRREYTNAMAVAEVLGHGYPELAAARRALAEESGNENELIGAVPPNLRKDEGLLYERLRWRRKNNYDQGAIEILNQAPNAAAMRNPSAWWQERHIIVRRLIEQKNFKAAYRLVSAHKQREGFPLAQAEWVSGWLALRFINEPWKAFEHFERLYKNVNSPLSKSRGAYWAGRASDVLKHNEIATQWYSVAARYPETFYGQLASQAMGRRAVFPVDARLQVDPKIRQAFKNSPLVKSATWLHAAGEEKETSVFLLRLSKNAKTAPDFIMSAELAENLGKKEVAIKIAQSLQQEKMISQTSVLYPTMVSELQNVRGVEWAFVNAIIRQESRFDEGAISSAGARGLMQLMPATAEEVARRNGIRHQKDWLTSRPSHNIELGSKYLAQMVDRFNGNYAMAAAAYNAGPGRVDKWIVEFGDPRKGQIDLIDWIELIPIYETRNYVERVLEGVYVYRDRLKKNQPPPVIPIHVPAK